MKKFSIVFLIVSITFSILSAGDTDWKAASFNPELLRYLKLKETVGVKKVTDSGYPLGYVPHSIKYVFSPSAGFSKAVVLPDVFDLRETGSLTPVKDQGTCGACWTFGTYGSIESRWLVLGAGSYDMSEQNLKNGNGFELDDCDGGNASMSTAYLVRGDGPISEEDDPYDVNDGEYVSGLTPLGYVSDARFLPNDPTLLKQVIYDSGAVYTDMYWDDRYYDSNNHTYYCDTDTNGTNHAVLLVGWNDTLQTAGGTGAWIIRNSWGTTFGDAGFFYISYNDKAVNSHPAFWPNRRDYDENRVLYYYDKLGAITSAGCGPSISYGVTKFSVTQDQQITSLGTWQLYANSAVSFELYSDFDGTNLSGLLAKIETQSCDYPGYYTFDFSEPVEVKGGYDIYIKVEYDCHNAGAESPVPIETSKGGYAAPDIESGVNWLSCDGTTWVAIGAGTGYEWDLCIKAYGETGVTAIGESGEEIPGSFMLRQNYPNPFNPATVIKYSIDRKSLVNLTVYNTLGQAVKELVNEELTPGSYQIRFEAGDLPSGVYYYRLKSGNLTETKKMVYIR